MKIWGDREFQLRRDFVRRMTLTSGCLTERERSCHCGRGEEGGNRIQSAGWSSSQCEKRREGESVSPSTVPYLAFSKCVKTEWTNKRVSEQDGLKRSLGKTKTGPCTLVAAQGGLHTSGCTERGRLCTLVAAHSPWQQRATQSEQ